MASMAYDTSAGLTALLKDGHQHLSATDGAVLRNVVAARELARIVRSSLGPHGRNKLVVNHLEKATVTSDCATIVRELEIEHPAAKMLSLAAETQDRECGDGTNLTVSFAGELLDRTEALLRSGLHVSEVVAGYRRAAKELHTMLPSLVTFEIGNAEINRSTLTAAVKPVVAAKQFGCEDVLASLVAEACTSCLTVNSSTGRRSLSTDSVRVMKVMGGNVGMSKVIGGYVAPRSPETTRRSTKGVDAPKIAVFGCGIEASGTEAKGTVLMNDASDLLGYNKSEEAKMEELIKSIKDSGADVLVSGGTVSEMALHFIQRYDMMCLKISSKWELRRLCAAVGATALVRLGPPTPDEMGRATLVNTEEVGARHITVFYTHNESSDEIIGGNRLVTILLRASTSGVLADLGRAVDDGVRAASALCRDGRMVPGAGATEAELAVRMRAIAESSPGLDQYAVGAFADSLEFVPITLAENAGLDSQGTMAALRGLHATTGSGGEKKQAAGVDVEGADGLDGGIGVKEETETLDILSTKTSAFKVAVDAALTVLKVDQIIMSRPAGAGRK